MSSVLSTLFFASAAAAQVTTSIWFPGERYGDESYQASVIGAKGDDVTMAIELAGDEYYGTAETVTFHGSTSYENVITTTDSYGDYEGDLTVSLGCSKSGSKAACTYSYNGPVAWSSYCEDYTSYTEVEVETETYTFDSPESTVVQVSTYDFRDQIPDFCLTGSTLPDEYAIMTMGSDEMDEIVTYAVTITAGAAKLGATAGATPSNSAATPTGTLSGLPSATPGSNNNSTNPDGSPTPSGPAEQSSTGAAAPMKTLAPALAGMGALVAALL